MWNKTYVTPGIATHSTSNNITTIHEHKAPADDTIRIYKELLEKAQKDIVDTIELKNNTVNLTAVLFKDHLTTKTICRYKILINNKKIEGEVKISSYNFSNKRKVIKQILEKVAQNITIDLVSLTLENDNNYYFKD